MEEASSAQSGEPTYWNTLRRSMASFFSDWSGKLTKADRLIENAYYDSTIRKLSLKSRRALDPYAKYIAPASLSVLTGLIISDMNVNVSKSKTCAELGALAIFGLALASHAKQSGRASAESWK